MDFLKKIWKDPVWSKVISAIIIALLSFVASIYLPAVKDFLLTPVPLWVAIMAFVVFYILIRSFSYYGKTERQKRVLKKHEIELREKKIDEYRDETWSAFIALDDEDMELLVRLFNYEKIDPDNERVRMLSNSDRYVFDSIIKKTEIPLPSSVAFQRLFRPCIVQNFIGNKVYLTFDFYFYELLKHFAKTGEKLKIRPY